MQLIPQFMALLLWLPSPVPIPFTISSQPQIILNATRPLRQNHNAPSLPHVWQRPSLL